MSTNIIKGKCDICYQKDGFQGHNLQECKTCHVKAHETCMGMISTGRKDLDWECFACQSTKGGTLPRPRECSLCSVDDGTHVMYPLYDTHGKKGKQMILPPNKSKGLPERSAWVHGLCAFFVASNPKSSGCVYGCDKDGNYEGDDDERSDEDSATSHIDDIIDDGDGNDASDGITSKNKDSKNDEDVVELMSTHHFVIAHKSKYGKETDWTIRIKELRKLKCSYCGLKDNQNSLRIPIQCCWNDDHELAEFKRRHHPSSGSEGCYVALHPGCARWKKDDFGKDPEVNRCFFYPGVETNDDNDGLFEQPICNGFCQNHARLIALGKKKQKANAKSTNEQPSKKIADGTTNKATQSHEISAAALELRRAQLEKETQEQIREKRREDLLQRKKKLLKTMRKDLDDTVLPLLRQGVDRTAIKQAQAKRKLHWSKESKRLFGTSKERFNKFWKTILDELQASEEFRDGLDVWDRLNVEKEANEEDTGNSDSNNDDNNPSTNRWSHLWLPHYNGKGWDEPKEWDTEEYIDSV